MVYENQCLKVKMSLDEEDSAVCIAFKANKYRPDMKYLSFLVQQQNSN